MLSDAHIDAANRAVTQVFETTSLAWRTIPHWFTGDPGRTAIRNDGWYSFDTTKPPTPVGKGPYGGAADTIELESEEVLVTLAAATASTPDQVVSAASAKAVEIAKLFDQAVAEKLATPALANSVNTFTVSTDSFGTPEAGKVPVTSLLGARQAVEVAGYMGSRCVWAGSAYFEAFHHSNGTRLILPACASVLQMGSIYRWDPADPTDKVEEKVIQSTALIIGRRQEIAPGRAFEAAPGPEPIDLAVSVPPSIEIVGDDQAGNIQLAVRIRYALRFKDNRAVVVWTTT